TIAKKCLQRVPRPDRLHAAFGWLPNFLIRPVSAVPTQQSGSQAHAALRAAVGHTSARMAPPPIRFGHIDKRSQANIRCALRTATPLSAVASSRIAANLGSKVLRLVRS